MLKYIISGICICLGVQGLFAQENTPKEFTNNILKNSEIVEKVETVKDSINPLYNPKTYGLRIGFDVIKPIYMFSKDYFNGAEIVADYRLKTNLFVAGEAGFIERDLKEDQFNNTVKGSYLKAGINYNLFTNWLDMDNELYLGARYGFATFSNTLHDYTIYQNGDLSNTRDGTTNENFFPPKQVNTSREFSGLNAHWVEFVAGIKVEIFSNLYFGFMASISKLITTKTGDNFDNTYAPGMGRISKNGSGANINYTISYRIPLYKK
ncbi:DUF6048 family protein [Wenyingzhuangia sp. IMCC45574]